MWCNGLSRYDGDFLQAFDTPFFPPFWWIYHCLSFVILSLVAYSFFLWFLFFISFSFFRLRSTGMTWCLVLLHSFWDFCLSLGPSSTCGTDNV